MAHSHGHMGNHEGHHAEHHHERNVFGGMESHHHPEHRNESFNNSFGSSFNSFEQPHHHQGINPIVAIEEMALGIPVMQPHHNHHHGFNNNALLVEEEMLLAQSARDAELLQMQSQYNAEEQANLAQIRAQEAQQAELMRQQDLQRREQEYQQQLYQEQQAREARQQQEIEAQRREQEYQQQRYQEQLAEQQAREARRQQEIAEERRREEIAQKLYQEQLVREKAEAAERQRMEIQAENNLEERRVSNYEAYQTLINTADSMSFANLCNYINQLRALSDPIARFMNNEHTGLPKSKDSGLFDVILNNTLITVDNKFHLINLLLEQKGFSPYIQALFTEPTINTLLNLENTANLLNTLYLNALSTPNFQIAPHIENRIWAKLITSSNTDSMSMFSHLLQSGTHKMNRVMVFVETWRNTSVNLNDPLALKDFYLKILNHCYSVNAEFDALLKQSYCTLTKNNYAQIAALYSEAKQEAEVGTLVTQWGLQANDQDFLQYRNHYFKQVQDRIATKSYHEVKADEWLPCIKRNDNSAEELFKMIANQTYTAETTELLIRFLHCWISNTTQPAQHDKIFQHYVNFLQHRNTEATSLQEITFWHALLNADPTKGEKLFHTLVRFPHVNKILAYTVAWMTHLNNPNTIHDTYKHQMKMDEIISITTIHAFLEDLKDIAQVRALEALQVNNVELNHDTKHWFTSGIAFFKPKSEKAYQAIINGSARANDELVELKQTFESDINNKLAEKNLPRDFKF